MFKTIYISNYPIDFHSIKDKLETEGIDSFIYDEHLVGIDPFKSVAIGGVKLNVSSDQSNPAKRIPDFISEDKLAYNDGGYVISEVLEISEHKYLICKVKTRTALPAHFRSEILSKAEIDNLIKENVNSGRWETRISDFM